MGKNIFYIDRRPKKTFKKVQKSIASDNNVVKYKCIHINRYFSKQISVGEISMIMFVCGFHPTQECFRNVEMTPLTMKGWKFRSVLNTPGH